MCLCVGNILFIELFFMFCFGFFSVFFWIAGWGWDWGSMVDQFRMELAEILADPKKNGV